jgi:hypothetical protein
MGLWGLGLLGIGGYCKAFWKAFAPLLRCRLCVKINPLGALCQCVKKKLSWEYWFLCTKWYFPVKQAVFY